MPPRVPWHLPAKSAAQAPLLHQRRVIGQNGAMKLIRFYRACLALLLCSLLSLSAGHAAGTATSQEEVVVAVERYLKTQTQGLSGRVDISVGQLDPRTQLSSCAGYEPFVPPGNRLWGKTMVGVRCLGPANWTIYVPVQVRVFGAYVVARRPIGPGQQLAEDDLELRQGDLSTLPAGVLTDVEQGVGKTTKGGLGGGQPVRAEALLAAMVVQQGQDVRVIYKGPGFSASNEGKALNNAADGQVARVRTAGGQTISGIARPGGIVEIGP